MKNIIVLILFSVIGASSYWVYNRYRLNSSSPIPFPYVFHKDTYDGIKSEDAPIVIIGDRIGDRLARLIDYMSSRISQDLSKNVKIISLAEKGEGLHRTLRKIQKLGKLPLITIYLGGSEETFEKRFYSKDIKTINKNFKRYNDDRIKTLLMIFPSLSPFIYEPINYKKLTSKIVKDDTNYTDNTIQKRNMVHFKLFEEELHQLFSYIKEKGSYLFAISQPLNYDSPPKKVCNGSTDDLIDNELSKSLALIKKKDFKKAYGLTKNLTLLANSNAEIFYIHAKVAESLGYTKESIKYFEMSMALDCSQWRGNPVYNKILSRTAKKNEVLIFDFNKLLLANRNINITFEDDVYPQNLYVEKMIDILSARIKKLLKL